MLGPTTQSCHVSEKPGSCGFPSRSHQFRRTPEHHRARHRNPAHSCVYVLNLSYTYTFWYIWLNSGRASVKRLFVVRLFPRHGPPRRALSCGLYGGSRHTARTVFVLICRETRRHMFNARSLNAFQTTTRSLLQTTRGTRDEDPRSRRLKLEVLRRCRPLRLLLCAPAIPCSPD